MIYVTRKEHFNAAHRVYNPNWTEEKNLEVFGKCAHLHWHGHNFELHVTVKGSVNPDTGFVIDLKKLKDIIRDSVIEKLDHRNLNLDVDFLQGKMASTENLAIGIWDELFPLLKAPNHELHSIRLYETDNNYVDYYGGN